MAGQSVTIYKNGGRDGRAGRSGAGAVMHDCAVYYSICCSRPDSSLHDLEPDQPQGE